MQIKYKIFITCLLFFGLNPLKSQENLSLEQAIQTGLENNFSIKISKLNIQQTSNNNRWGATGFLPVLNANIGTDLSQNRVPDSVNISSTGVDAGVTLNWTVFNGFSAMITKSQFDLLEDLSAGSGAIVVENTIQGIILAYYNVLLQEKQLDVLETLKTISGDRYRQFIIKQNLGTSVTFDVLQSKNEFLSDSSNYLYQQLNVDNAYRSLNLLMAGDLDNKYILTDSLIYIEEDFSLESLQEKALASNKTLMNQYINNEILKKDVNLAKYAFLPTVNITGSASKNLLNATKIEYLNPAYTIEPTTTNPLTYYMGFTMNFNLFNGGNRYNALKNAKLSEEIGLIQKDQLELSVNNQLMAQYYLYLTQLQVLEVAIENEKAARLNLQLAKDKYALGVLNSFNYRDVQLAYLSTAFARYQSIFNIINTHTELLRLSGGLITEN